MGLLIKKQVTNILEVPLNIIVNFIGRGLSVNRSELPIKLEANIGNGLTFSQTDQISIDQIIDENKSFEFSECTNSSLSLDGRKLILTKQFANYKICKNKDGVVVDIIYLNSREEKDEVIFTDIGYTPSISNPQSNQSPTFYKS